MDDDYPRARVLEDEDGNIYLDDPVALGVIKAVEHHNRKIAIENCHKTFAAPLARQICFVGRIERLSYLPLTRSVVRPSASTSSTARAQHSL